MKHWDLIADEPKENDSVDKFLLDIIKVFEKYNLSISDDYGGFIIEELKVENVKLIMESYTNIKEGVKNSLGVRIGNINKDSIPCVIDEPEGDIKIIPDIPFFEFCCSKTTKEHGKFDLLERYKNRTDLIYHDNYAEYEIHDAIGLNSVKHLLFPLLLTKAVEGVNMSDPWKIDIFFEDDKGWGWSYKDYRNLDEYHQKSDGAKEAALRYVMIFERERGI